MTEQPAFDPLSDVLDLQSRIVRSQQALIAWSIFAASLDLSTLTREQINAFMRARRLSFATLGGNDDSPEEAD